MDRLKGKVAIVTGSATGLGRAIAELYAEEGARVVVADIDVEGAEETLRAIHDAGGEATFIRTDVSKSNDVQRMVDTAEKHFGQLNIMTANAATLGRAFFKNIVDITEDEFKQIMDINFGGVWMSFKYAIPAILRAGGGAMSVTASLAAHRGYAGLPAYTASKGAIVALARSVAAELGETIRVNVVSGGGGFGGDADGQIAKKAVEIYGADPAGLQGLPDSSALEDHALSRAGLVRPNTSKEIAHAHLFLVSDEASYINGQVIVADLGFTSLAPDQQVQKALAATRSASQEAPI